MTRSRTNTAAFAEARAAIEEAEHMSHQLLGLYQDAATRRRLRREANKAAAGPSGRHALLGALMRA